MTARASRTGTSGDSVDVVVQLTSAGVLRYSMFPTASLGASAASAAQVRDAAAVGGQSPALCGEVAVPTGGRNTTFTFYGSVPLSFQDLAASAAQTLTISSLQASGEQERGSWWR